MTLQADGKVLLAGYGTFAGSYDSAVARYTTAGVLDSGFGGGEGIVTTRLSEENDYARAVVSQPDGRVLLVGLSISGGNSDFALVRYASSPLLLDLQASTDSGIDLTDNITNYNTPTFLLRAAPYFRLYRNGDQISSDYETGSTAGTIYTVAAQEEGIHSFALCPVDVAGNAPYDPTEFAELRLTSGRWTRFSASAPASSPQRSRGPTPPTQWSCSRTGRFCSPA
jgi:uncharacterized delta-60 repeat protein